MRTFIKKILLINKLKLLIGINNYEKIKHFLRYYGVHFFGYKVNDQIYFGNNNAENFFVKKLQNCKLYLEYGCGSSTKLAKNLKKKFYSIEGDKNFYKYMKKIIRDENLIYKSLGIVKYYSIPINYDQDLKPLNFISKNKKNLIKEYSNGILNYFEIKQICPDLVLIDGRYRVLCALNLYNFYKEKKIDFNIIIDDYNDRPSYHVLENYFEIEKIGRFGVANKVKFVNNINNDLEKFYLDCR